MSIRERLTVIKERINQSLKNANRVDNVRLVAVTKTHPKHVIEEIYKAGIIDVGENYVQEMICKFDVNLPLNWHFIGTLQRNKVKYIIGKVFLIHSLDSLALASEIDKRAGMKGIVQDALIQINQGEDTKGGKKIEEVENFLKELNNFHNIRVRGFMAIPPFFEEPEKVRRYFRELKQLRDDLNRKSCYREPLTELSMGMSSDFEIAIEEGATIVRIGSALLGERKYSF